MVLQGERRRCLDCLFPQVWHHMDTGDLTVGRPQYLVIYENDNDDDDDDDDDGRDKFVYTYMVNA